MLKSGDIVGGRFALEEQLGEGSFGGVWRALDQKSGVKVALKMLHARLSKKPRMLERFAREAKLLETLDHANIVKAIAWSAEERDPYLALELIDGRSLHEELIDHAKRRMHLAPSWMLKIARALCDAIDYAHHRGVVHRDLKPRNVMVLSESDRESERVKVLDFGVAKILDAEASEATTQGRVLGTLLYLAPEQIEGAAVDERADIFALGAVLFEMLTLAKAWQPARDGRSEADARMDIVQRILRGVRPRASTLRPGLGAATDEVLIKALAIDKSARYQTARELYAAIEHALAIAQIADTVVDHDAPIDLGSDPLPLVAVDFSTASEKDIVLPPPSLTPVMPVDLDLGTSGGDWMREPRKADDHPRRGVAKRARKRASTQRPFVIAASVALVLGVGTGLFIAPMLSGPSVRVSRIEPASPVATPSAQTAHNAQNAQQPIRPRTATVAVETTAPLPATVKSVRTKRKVAAEPKQEAAAANTVEESPKRESADPLADLRAGLAKLKREPDQVDARFELTEMIEKRSSTLPSSEARTAIKRCLLQSTLIPEANQALEKLDQCITRLDRAIGH